MEEFFSPRFCSLDLCQMRFSVTLIAVPRAHFLVIAFALRASQARIRALGPMTDLGLQVHTCKEVHVIKVIRYEQFSYHSEGEGVIQHHFCGEKPAAAYVSACGRQVGVKRQV